MKLNERKQLFLILSVCKNKNNNWQEAIKRANGILNCITLFSLRNSFQFHS